MNDSDLQELLDKVVAERLTPEEKRRWDALLAERPELEEELALAEALRALRPPPSVSSNFTSLVMQEIRRTESKQSIRRPSWLRWPGLIRIAATGAAVIIAVTFTVVRQQEAKEARQAAETIAASFQAVTRSPQAQAEAEAENALAVFRDFEAIRQLPPNTPGVDDSFLSALGK